jgi:hypothetical protein
MINSPNGPFTERSPSREKKKGGALGPWPRLAKVRVSRGLAWPHPSRSPPLSLLLAIALSWLGEGARVHPSPYIKRGS